MGDKSSIEWTGATLNPWDGCTKVSPACAHCYIDRALPLVFAKRKFVNGHMPLVFHMERLGKMVRKTKPTVYFVNSLSDLFHEDATDDQIAQVFGAMAAAPQHTFQVLTKRPDRMRHLLGTGWFANEADEWARHYGAAGCHAYPLPNVWLGVTIENHRFVARADLLRQTPAAVRFVSAEPLLGPLVPEASRQSWPEGHPDAYMKDHDHGAHRDGACPGCEREARNRRLGDGLDLTGIDWLIVGGESGPGYRKLSLNQVRGLRDAASQTGTAFFVKQLGGARPGTLLEHLPEDLRIREYPSAVAVVA